MGFKQNDSKVVRWAGIAGMVGGAGYVVKVAVIFAIDINSPVIGPLYFIGALVPLFAAAGVAAKYASKIPARIGLYLAVAFLHLMFVMAGSEAIEAAVVALTDMSRVYAAEVGLGLLGLIWVVVGYRLWAGPADRNRAGVLETA